MQSNKLRLAIRATAAVAVLGMAGQASAYNFKAGDVDASVYGYAQLSASYDLDADVADSTQSGSWSPSSATNGDGHFGASANQSRFGIKMKNADGVMANIEGDFYTGGQFRLRHAYGTYKNILAGQTWSNYNSFVGSTSTIDFSGLAGQAGYQSRTAQLRYTSGPMSFSLEDPKGGIAGTAGDKSGMPVLTARLEDKAGGISYSFGALLKQNSYEDTAALTATTDDTSFGFAVFGAGKVAVSDMISIQGAINYTDGANGYLYRSGGADAYVDGSGSLESLSGMGGTIGTSLGLGGGRSVNIGYGLTKLDVDDLGAAALESRQNAFVNYMWTPVKDVMMGVEYGYYDSETQGGASEDYNRLMFATRYTF